ncbi:MAG: phosphopantetheine-binding protein [Christensenellaceae bacterium]|jgi:acyl carrier protein|nr:phosphopantetheine-binding protein [Christensenellaceae bacterium]
MDDFSRLRELVHDITGVPTELITPESTAEQLNMDMLDITELVMDIEEAFDVLIEDDVHIQGMGDLLACIKVPA